jgi:hypothetical protein
MASISQFPWIIVDIIVPGELAPISGMGIMAAGMLKPFSARKASV